MDTISVLLVDDQKLFLENLKTVLELTTEDIRVVGTASNGEEAVRLTDEVRPEIVLMDVRMPTMDGVEAVKIIREQHPEIKILMLTTFDNDDYVRDALKYGASGYILKNIPPQELCEIIRALRAGGIIVSPEVASKMVRWEEAGVQEKAPSDRASLRELILSLSPREKEVIGHIAMAYSNRQIAERMFISEQTVKNYISRIYAKLGVSKRSKLMKLYHDLSLTSDDLK